MIVDTIANWRSYPLGESWKKAFEFLSEIRPDAEEKYYWLDGKDLYARVMSYDTIDESSAKIEAHRAYIDIQTPLIHGEGIRWFPLDGLQPLKDYDPEKDVCFYSDPGNHFAKIDLYPGQFGFFGPRDAHQPKLIVGSKTERIKKAVVKIRLERLPMMQFR